MLHVSRISVKYRPSFFCGLWGSRIVQRYRQVAEKKPSRKRQRVSLRPPYWFVYTGLFEMIVGVLTTCHTQYTWDRIICIFFLFNRTTLQVFVTYPIGALYVHPLWFYRHQHDNRVRSKLFVAFEEQKTNFMSLAILFHFLCAQHISDINISIIRS